MPDSRTPLILGPAVCTRGVRHLQRADKQLQRVITHVGGCPLVPTRQVYRSLFRAVLYQQLAGPAAAAIHRRVCAPYGGRTPTPAQFLATPETALRAAGLSRQKLSYLRDLAGAFAEGRLRPQRLVRMSDDEVIASVTSVRGIGTWTAHMLLIFSLGRTDVLPVGDYGVRKGMQRLYGLTDLPNPQRMQEIAAAWRPYRSIGSWYIWRSMDMNIPNGAE